MSAIDEYQRLLLSVNTLAAAEWVWERVLTRQERTRLGSLQNGLGENRRTVDMWRRVRGGSEVAAVIALAEQLNLTDRTTAKWLLEQFDHLPSDVAPALDQARPNWIRTHGELQFDGEVIRKVQQPDRALRIVTVLDAFQAAGWPSHIHDPLPDPSDDQRLRKTIETLNKGLQRIRFLADGTGQGIRWTTLAEASSPSGFKRRRERRGKR